MIEKRFLNVDQVAELMGISTRTVWKLASSGSMPGPVSFGRSRRWDMMSLEAFFAREQKGPQNQEERR